MPGFCHLVCVTSVNNNKFYDMQDLGNGEFEAKYGRIGATCTTVRYPMSRWYSIYNQKLKKGYIDQTSLVSVSQVQTNEKYKPIEDEDVAKLIAYLREKARDTVEKNYKVASTQVSAAMVAKAQSIINRLFNTASNLTVAQFNDDLIELFGVIPRKMSYVPDYLASRANEFPNIIHREQQLLDVMAGQISGDIVEQKTTGNENETVLTDCEPGEEYRLDGGIAVPADSFLLRVPFDAEIIIGDTVLEKDDELNDGGFVNLILTADVDLTVDGVAVDLSGCEPGGEYDASIEDAD